MHILIIFVTLALIYDGKIRVRCSVILGNHFRNFLKRLQGIVAIFKNGLVSHIRTAVFHIYIMFIITIVAEIKRILVIDIMF